MTSPAAPIVPTKRGAGPFDVSYSDAKDSDDDVDVRAAGKNVIDN